MDHLADDHPFEEIVVTLGFTVRERKAVLTGPRDYLSR